MKQKFIVNLLLLIGLNLIVKPFWIFGIDRAVQNLVGAEQYGQYFALFNFSILFNMFLDLGLSNYNNRNIAQNHHLLAKSVQKILTLKLLLAIIYFLITFIFAFAFRYNLQQIKLLIFLSINQFLLSFILYFRSNISGLQMFKLDSFLSVLDRLILIVFCSILLWGKWLNISMNIDLFVYLQTFSYLITCLVCLSVVLVKTEMAIFIKPKFKNILIILKESIPYALLILLMSLYYRIDSVILERILPDGQKQAGIYAQAFRIIEAFASFAFLFPSLLLPIFARMLKLKEPIESLVKFSFNLLLIPSSIMIVSSCFYSQEIMTLLYRENTLISGHVFGILIIGFIGYSFTYIYGTLLTANGNLKLLNFLALIGMLVNIALNLIFIPIYGVIGAAVINVVTQFVMAFGQFLIFRRLFKFQFETNYIIRTLLFILILAAITGLIKYFGVNRYWILEFFIGIAFGFVLSFLLQLFSLKNVFAFLQTNIMDRK